MQPFFTVRFSMPQTWNIRGDAFATLTLKIHVLDEVVDVWIIRKDHVIHYIVINF